MSTKGLKTGKGRPENKAGRTLDMSLKGRRLPSQAGVGLEPETRAPTPPPLYFLSPYPPQVGWYVLPPGPIYPTFNTRRHWRPPQTGWSSPGSGNTWWLGRRTGGNWLPPSSRRYLVLLTVMASSPASSTCTESRRRPRLREWGPLFSP